MSSISKLANETHALTTGQVASLARLSQQTVIREFDQGRINGYRLPRSGHRRMMLTDVLDWMKENGIPVDRLDAEFGLDKGQPEQPVPDMRQA